jgi:hypothetical protein
MADHLSTHQVIGCGATNTDNACHPQIYQQTMGVVWLPRVLLWVAGHYNSPFATFLFLFLRVEWLKKKKKKSLVSIVATHQILG